MRVSSSKLVFLDLIDNGIKAQVVVTINSEATQKESEDLSTLQHLARRGDWYSEEHS